MDSDDDAPPQLVSTDAVEPEAAEEGGGTNVRVPITIVTGYLGAGKTTLLNYILSARHGKRIAVIMNEFGDSVDIEKSLTVSKNGQQVEEWLDVGNGCICCSVKDSGVNAIENLMKKKGAFDYILLETTGLADPGNIAPLFWVDDGLGSSIYLDGIVTLVDAKNILKSLDDPMGNVEGLEDHGKGPVLTTAHVQISHADVLVINKSDMVSVDELNAVKSRLTAINGLAKVHVTNHAVVPKLEGFLLDLHAYDNIDSLEDPSSKGHSHIDPTISTMSIQVPELDEGDIKLIDAWIQRLLWDGILPGTDESIEIHRLKARLVFRDGSVRMVQGVREVFEILDPIEKTAGSGAGKLVVIGRHFHGLNFDASLMAALQRS